MPSTSAIRMLMIGAALAVTACGEGGATLPDAALTLRAR